MTSPRPSPSVFRPEIEGLRAVAAILVALYHVFFGRVSGGVDVFFLVAGFLITTTLLRQAESGRLNLGRYLSRLARRLLPAALVVLAFVVVATTVWLPESRRGTSYRETAASLLYLENWALARRSTDYLARDEALSPVQHFWAMSIQGQFYLIWFVLMAIALMLSRRHLTAVLTGLLIAVFTVSLAFSIYLTEVNQPLAYFHTGARVWEFAAGGLLALAITRIDVRQGSWSIPVGWIGLGLIISCGILVPVADSFPGWIALWPVGGAVLVLAAGQSTSRFAVSRLLSSRPLVYIGGISYALYLWHWPLLVLYLSHAGGGTADLLPGLLIIAISFALAAATKRWIEQPVHRSSFGTRRPAIAVGLTAAMLSTLAVSAFAVGRETTAQTAEKAQLSHRDFPGPEAVSDGWDNEPGVYLHPPTPRLAVAKRDQADVYTRGCHVGLLAIKPVLCTDGAVNSDVTVMLVGGSHSAHWQPALRRLANQHGFTLLTGTKSACQFSSEALAPDAAKRKACRDWNRAMIQEIKRVKPTYVFTTSTRAWREDHELVPQGYLDQWAILEKAGIQVIAIRDTPRSAANQVECLETNPQAPQKCGVERSAFYADVDPAQALDPMPHNVTFLDLSDLLCNSTWCPAIIGNMVVYFDHSHMTATWSYALAPFLEDQLPNDLLKKKRQA